MDTQPAEPEPRRVAFRPERVDRLLGTALGMDAQRDVLRRVGIETEEPSGEVEVAIAAGDAPASVTAAAGAAVLATVPTWRRDIEVEADLAEEIARVHGYERVPARLPTTVMPGWRETPLAARDAIRRALAGAGLTEAVTYALVSPRRLEAFGWSFEDRPAAGEAAREGTPITVTNPLSMDHSVLRQSLVGSLAEVIDSNTRHGQPDVAVFEVGKGYGRVGDESREWWRLGLALTRRLRRPGLEPAAARGGPRRREGPDRAGCRRPWCDRPDVRAAHHGAAPAPGTERDGRVATRRRRLGDQRRRRRAAPPRRRGVGAARRGASSSPSCR